MAAEESVSSSLINRAELLNREITAVDAVIDGERESILLYRDGEKISAWLNICPHAGRRLDYAPGRFLIDRGLLICASHGASFELDQGRCVAGPCKGASLRALKVSISDEGLVDLASLASPLPDEVVPPGQ